MENKMKAERSDSVNSNENVFSREIDVPELKDEKTKKIFALLNSPVKFILQGGGSGLVAVRKVLGMLILFFFSNLFLVVYSTYRFFISEGPLSNLVWPLVILAVGVTCTAFAIYRAYQYLLIEAIHLVYNGISGIFRQLSMIMVNKASQLLKSDKQANLSMLTHSMDLGNVIHNSFKKLPRMLRKGMLLLLNRIPLMPMIIDLRSDIVQGNNELASKKLVNKMDEFIQDSIFGKNSNRWMLIIYLINILAALLIIQYKIG